MPRLTLLATLALAALLLATACTGDDAPEDPDLLVVAAASFQQVACEPVPLQLINTRTGETRLGPTDRYVGLAISPAADRVAAIRLDWNLCGSGERIQPETFTVLFIDVATLEVTELTTTDKTMIYLHWSADAEHLAVVGSDTVTVFEVDPWRKLTSTPLENTSARSRGHMIWPDLGPFLLIYSSGNTLIGQRTFPANTYDEWLLDCPGNENGSFGRIHQLAAKGATVDYRCRESLQPAHQRRVVLDLDEGTLGDSVESDAYRAWIDQFFALHELVDTRYAGGEIYRGYVTDATGTFDVLSVTYLRSGKKFTDARFDSAIPDDVQTAIVIRKPNGEIIYIPVDITPTDPDYSMGPLHDVAILPD